MSVVFRSSLVVAFLLVSSQADAREMAADRPDKTESPITVDKGRFQFETDFVSYTKEGASSELLFANINAKYGVTNWMDLQVIFAPARRVAFSSGELQGSKWGISDLTLRTKFNFFGNDEGERALGLIGFVTLPTAADSKNVTGGLSVPYAFSLGSFDIGVMAQLDMGDTFDLSTMATCGHALVGDLSGYVEFFNTLPSFRTTGWIATADVGLTYGVNEDFQLDANAHFGVTDAADDLYLFTGFTWRL